MTIPEFAYDTGEAPFYTEQLYKLQEETPDFGLGTAVWDANQTYLYAHRMQIIDTFNRVYKYREIGQETEERWMTLIQTKLNLISDQYDRAFRMYETNLIDDIERDVTSTSSGQGTDTGTVATEGTNKQTFQDTPVTPLQAVDYATNKTDNESDEVQTRNLATSQEATNTTRYKDRTILELVNRNVDLWRNLINDFVNEFDDLFFNTMTRV